MEVVKQILNIILYPLRLLVILLIIIYKKLISPLFPDSCIYKPSCSSYMLEAIKKHGLIGGFLLGVNRITRCNSKHSGGVDPVPENIKGEAKWII